MGSLRCASEIGDVLKSELREVAGLLKGVTSGQ